MNCLQRKPWTWIDPLVQPKQWERDVRYGTWNVRSLYRESSLTAAARELQRYKLDFVGVQDVRCGKEGTIRAEDYNIFYERVNENHQLGRGFFVHQRIVSAVKKAEVVNDRVTYIVPRRRWCNMIVLNEYAPTKEKSNDPKDSFHEDLEQAFDHFTKYHMKILLRDFNAKVGGQNIFKMTIGNDSLHQDSKDNGVRIVNFATSKNLVVKSMMFPHQDIHKYTWTSPDGKTHNQIVHILINRKWHSSILDVRSFRGAD